MKASKGFVFFTKLQEKKSPPPGFMFDFRDQEDFTIALVSIATTLTPGGL